MIALHLGVMDIPYSDGTGQTTGDVAESLEQTYGIMQFFVDEIGGDALSKAFEESASAAIEDLFSGAPIEIINLTNDAEQEIQDAFRIFLDQKEMDYKVAGVPTKASLAGVSGRKKSPYAKSNGPRPSFIDTGTYSAAFKAWTEDD